MASSSNLRTRVPRMVSVCNNALLEYWWVKMRFMSRASNLMAISNRIHRLISSSAEMAVLTSKYTRLKVEDIVVVDSYSALALAISNIVASKLVGISSRNHSVQVSNSKNVFVFPTSKVGPLTDKIFQSLFAILQSERVEKVAYQYTPLDCIHNRLVSSANVPASVTGSDSVGLDVTPLKMFDAAVDAHVALLAYKRMASGADKEYDPSKVLEDVLNGKVPEEGPILPPYRGLKPKNIVLVLDEEQLLIAEQQLSACPAIGLDSEWWAFGQSTIKPQLVQLATPRKAFLFSLRDGQKNDLQRSVMATLKRLLESETILKVGFDLGHDISFLNNSLHCNVTHAEDLKDTLAHLKTAVGNTVGLKRSIAVLMQQSFVKNRRVTMSDWDVPLIDLSMQQKLYAGNDAHAALLVYLVHKKQQQDSIARIMGNYNKACEERGKQT